MTSLRRLSVLVVLPVLALTAACGSSDNSEDAAPPKTAESKCSYVESGDAAKKVDLPSATPTQDAATEVTIKTDRGDIKVTLDPEKAPCTVNSFLSLAGQGYFDGTTCHRLVVGGLNVLQCGDPTGTGTGGPGYSFKDELVPSDTRLEPCTGQTDPQSGKEVCTYTSGTLAMANAGADTNGSQFFLVFSDSLLPAAYTVFGKMNAAGVKVVEEIAAQGNAADGVGPKTPVTIEKVS